MAACIALAAVFVFAFFGLFGIEQNEFGDGAGALFRFLLIELGVTVAIAYFLFAVFAILVPGMLSWGGWVSCITSSAAAPKLIIFTRVPAGAIRPPRFISN